MLAALNNLAVNYSYNYNYTNPVTTTSGHSTPLALVVILAVVGIGALALLILLIAAAWKVFTKAGRPGWAIFIPFYNSWLLAEMAGRPGWWGLYPLLGVVPFAGWLASFVVFVVLCVGLARNFGKSDLFGVFGLAIFNFVGFPILAFGSAEYRPDGASDSDRDEPPYPKITAEPEA
jgi:hypothetical protein